MSIVTLKKKTQAKYNNMSVGSKNGGFSLNGTHRSQGYVGQTMLSRHLPQTLMKGNVIKGHGGCCGKYPIKPIVQSGVTDLNDPKVVKPAVIHNAGMIRTQYRWIWRPQPFAVVKPDATMNLNTQHDYITNLSTQTVSKIAKCNIKKTIDIGNGVVGCGDLDNTQLPVRPCRDVTQSEETIVAMSQSKYIENLKGSCVTLNKKNTVVSTQQTPFACGGV